MLLNEFPASAGAPYGGEVADPGELVDLIPALRAFARTFCRNKDDADDLVQETLSRALANLERFERGTRMKAWLFTIMHNTFLTGIKKTNRESPGQDDCVSGQSVIAPSQEWAQRSWEVAQAIDQLPEDQRQVIVLIGMIGIGYDDVAAICGCAIGTVKSRLNRARARLTETLGEDRVCPAKRQDKLGKPTTNPPRRPCANNPSEVSSQRYSSPF
jgi:RNA polymerase sigma-70 factor (ECF subfamily)